MHWSNRVRCCGLVKAWREQFSSLVLVAFVPIFFTNTGLNTNIGGLQTPAAWLGCGLVLLMAGVAYTILVRILLRHHGQDSVLHKAIGSDFKGNISLLAYIVAMPLAFVQEWVSMGIYFVVAAMWFIPDRRIESHLKE